LFCCRIRWAGQRQNRQKRTDAGQGQNIDRLFRCSSNCGISCPKRISRYRSAGLYAR